MTNFQPNRDRALAPTNQWDAQLYDTKHSFIARYGTELLQLLEPQPGEKILDLGCGTGSLTHEIALSGANVTGVDHANTMIEQAQKNYPTIKFLLQDATQLNFIAEFDAVFSNAALHWIKEAETVANKIARSLKPGGRLIAEFGGKGNIQTIITALEAVLSTENSTENQSLNPWYFPSIGEYASVLEKQGLEVQFATLYDRPTLLEDGEEGLKNWLKMFANSFFENVSEITQATLISEVEKQARSQLYRDGNWFADYRRIRVKAIKLDH